MDIYQERYLMHQDKKRNMLNIAESKKETENIINKDNLKYFLEKRHSQRIFNTDEITNEEKKYIFESIACAPSSCNRQPIYVLEILVEDIENIFKGATNWAKNGKFGLLILANKKAYKSINEKDYMPFLDAGVVIENIYLMSTALDIGCCFVNPNIKDDTILKSKYSNVLNDYYICGAMVFGKYDKVVPKNKRRNPEEVLIND